jgi:hypothetical protein
LANAAETMMTVKTTKAGSENESGAASASYLIDARIKELGDWRGETLARVRRLIREAAPQVAEAWKWRGVPVWEHEGILCTGETYKAVVKLTFANGAALADPSRLFNSSLEGNVDRRARADSSDPRRCRLQRGQEKTESVGGNGCEGAQW